MTFLDDVLAAGTKTTGGCTIARLLARLTAEDRTQLEDALEHPAATHTAIAKEIMKRGWPHDGSPGALGKYVGEHRRGACCCG